MSFKISSKRPQTEAETKQYFDYWDALLPQNTDFISRAIPLAQFAHESYWSTSELARNANNHAGHKFKGDDGWDKKRQYIKDAEEEDEKGNKYIIPDTGWRKYNSDKEFAEHHASWLSRTPSYSKIYEKALNAKTWQEQLRALQGTYALDSRYYELVKNYIERYDLTQYDIKRSEKVAKLTLEQAFAKLGLTFKKQLLPLTKTYGRVNRREGIVIHQTGAPQAGRNAQWMANYQRTMSAPSNREEKSWNYQVDDKEAIMSFEHDVATWQSSDGRGPGNTAHISIEACINADGNYAKSVDNLAKTMAVIAYVENFKNIESVTGRHYDFARDKKWCPAQIMNGQAGFTYAKVKAMAQAHLNTLKGATGSVEPINTANPQGLETSKIPDYTAPQLPFKRFVEGDRVTIDEIWAWYDDNKKEFMHSKKHDELAGTQFTIEEVKEIDPIGYSKIAYKSKEHNSWILEEDITEAREDWKVEELDPTLGDEGKEPQQLEEGQFWLGDKLYQVVEVGD